jgi:hypothetical protein
MRVPEEPVFIDLFRQNPVFTSLHLKSPVHVRRLFAVAAIKACCPVGGKVARKYLLLSFNQQMS